MGIDLSIIIVHYNAPDFLGLCLDAVYQNYTSCSYEVIVVDNASTQSCENQIRANYPEVRFIRNKENIGFARACNQGADEAGGRFLLFLNPDTIVPSDMVERVIRFADEKKEGFGAMGPFLVDGGGHYLKESKRHKPNIANSLSKLAGIYRLFNPGKKSQAYYDSSPNEAVAHTDILCGAFMVISKPVFNRIGGFDERYFMYGEDIDLSVRLLNEGLDIWYNPEIRVVHFKGESTVKEDPTYFRDFYGSMSIYVSNHLSIHGLFKYLFILPGIRLIRLTHMLFFLLRKSLAPFLDFILIFLCFWAGHRIWGGIHYGSYSYYLLSDAGWNYGLYSVIFLYFSWINGKYFSPKMTLFDGFKSWLYGLGVTLVIYSLFPEEIRFSRMSILIGALLILVIMGVQRFLFSTFYKEERGDVLCPVVAVTGNPIPDSLLANNGFEVNNRLKPEDLSPQSKGNLGTSWLFDITTMDTTRMIDFMMNNPGLDYYFLGKNRKIILSSRKPSSPGIVLDRYSHYKIMHPSAKLQKRIFDVVSTLILLFPALLISILFFSSTILQNIFLILKGNYTLVSYMNTTDHENLPRIKHGFISPYKILLSSIHLGSGEYRRHYALHYTVVMDIFVCTLGIRTLISSLMRDK